jgi:hypothetical protein
MAQRHQIKEKHHQEHISSGCQKNVSVKGKAIPFPSRGCSHP